MFAPIHEGVDVAIEDVGFLEEELVGDEVFAGGARRRDVGEGDEDSNEALFKAPNLPKPIKAQDQSKNDESGTDNIRVRRRDAAGSNVDRGGIDRVQRRRGGDELVASDGARLGWADLLANGNPKPPFHEDFNPLIHSAVRDPENVLVVPPAGVDREDVPGPVHLMRRRGAQRAYARIRSKAAKDLSHHGRGCGCVYFCIVYIRVGAEEERTFKVPAPGSVEFVAVKRLKLRVVDKYLQSGGSENPYREIARMQDIGDGIHVMPCLEALRDERYLYIVTPMGEATLCDKIRLGDRNEFLDTDRVRDWFIQIVRILAYLEHHGICHHDLSPDNFIFLSENRLVAYDMAMSLSMPTATTAANGGNQEETMTTAKRRVLMTPQGNFGTVAFMAPEIFANRVFDGVGSDLWSAVIILYILLTNQALYQQPHPLDISFRYYVLAGGLSSVPINERTVEILMEAFNNKSNDTQHQQRAILDRATAHLNLPPDAIELFENVLQVDPDRRWSLADVMESDFVQNGRNNRRAGG